MVRGEAARFLAVPLTTSLEFEFDGWKEAHDRVATVRKKVSDRLKRAGAEDAELPFTQAVLAYGSTLHALSRQDWAAALRHAREYKEMTRRPASELQTNPASALYAIASNVLIARAAQGAGRDQDGKAALPALLGILESPLGKETPADELALKAWRAAVEQQDRLNYNDPPEWYYPVRQSLGAAYYLRDRFAEAEETFRQDLKVNPGNPRSLYGLIESLRNQGKPGEPDLEKQFKKQWGNNPLPSFKTM
jgi:tetratricopeptide (TPR) repeat protein